MVDDTYAISIIKKLGVGYVHEAYVAYNNLKWLIDAPDLAVEHDMERLGGSDNAGFIFTEQTGSFKIVDCNVQENTPGGDHA